MLCFKSAFGPHAGNVIVLCLQLFEELAGPIAHLFVTFMYTVCIKETYGEQGGHIRSAVLPVLLLCRNLKDAYRTINVAFGANFYKYILIFVCFLDR